MSSLVSVVSFDHPAALRRDLARRVAALALVAVALSGWIVVLQHHSAAALQRAAQGTEPLQTPAMGSAVTTEHFDVAIASHYAPITPTSPPAVARTDYQASAQP